MGDVMSERREVNLVLLGNEPELLRQIMNDAIKKYPYSASMRNGRITDLAARVKVNIILAKHKPPHDTQPHD